MFSPLEWDRNKAKQVQFQEVKHVAKNVNHIAKDMSYFVTCSSKKIQNVMENGISNSKVELQVKPFQIIRNNPSVSISGPIPNMEVPVAHSLENVPKPVDETQPIRIPTLLPKL